MPCMVNDMTREDLSQGAEAEAKDRYCLTLDMGLAAAWKQMDNR